MHFLRPSLLLKLSFFMAILWTVPLAQARVCKTLFNKRISTSYSHIYAGQEQVGKDYAVYKELHDAGLNPLLSLDQLSNKQKKMLIKSLNKDLAEAIPAVRDPAGRIFLLDGHHKIYLATRLFSPISDIRIELDLIYDATQTGISWEQFVNHAINQHWFYAPTAAAILANPQQVHQLRNSVERSMLGLFFISIEDKYSVPMKGKYFAPFVQFYLADLIRQKGLYTFPSQNDYDEIPRLRKILLANQEVLKFLVGDLRANAPTSLREFLEDQLKNSSP
jgi:hypothetical protein